MNTSTMRKAINIMCVTKFSFQACQFYKFTITNTFNNPLLLLLLLNIIIIIIIIIVLFFLRLDSCWSIVSTLRALLFLTFSIDTNTFSNMIK